MTLESILSVTVGTILEFDVPFDGELTLHVANRSIGKGQAVKVGEKFGLRITRIHPVQARIGALGAQ
jgi:flagellar motor switch/type III secretory pathway protein FliN